MELTDTDPMPFGMHKGVKMQDVPVNYLHWFWHNGHINNEDQLNVKDYIKRSLDGLRIENPDLLWK